MKDDTVYLRHIIDCINKIEKNISVGRNQFMISDTHQDAVLRNLQTMAESTQRLSKELKAKYSEIEWSRIAAFRNILVHDYLGIDIERIWDIIQRDIPKLKSATLEILDKGQQRLF